jgi:hypothetical protein
MDGGSNWNFASDSESDDGLDLSKVAHRYKKSKQTVKPVHKVIPPTFINTPLPKPIQDECVQQNPSVIRTLLEMMDNDCPVIPTVKKPELTNTEHFSEISDDFAREIEAIIENETVCLCDEKDNTKAPASPGREYDKNFISGEIGIKKPMFNANIHNTMFEKNSGLLDVGKLKKLTQRFETAQHKKYKKYSDINVVAKDTFTKLRKRRKRRRRRLKKVVL